MTTDAEMVPTEETQDPGLPPRPIRWTIEVRFEDEHLIAFDKPSGLLVAPDRWDKDRDNLMAIVHKRWSPDWFNAHRLDQGTSGLLLCAKNREALRRLAAIFEKRQARKRYAALVAGAPEKDAGTLTMALADDPRRPGLMRTARDGQSAETRYEIVTRWRGCSLLRVWPLTGRTHQIRVHLAAIKCPIMGDVHYGGGAGLLLSRLKRGYKPPREGERPLIGRLALHADRLEFPHPVTGQPVVIESPLPHDFAVGIKYLDKFA
jgi:23S rRNA pseudouridine1911/1915/1917 synthase